MARPAPHTQNGARALSSHTLLSRHIPYPSHGRRRCGPIHAPPPPLREFKPETPDGAHHRRSP
eukprot:3044951-Pleurochrysis_carterae.AAC.1